MKHIKFRPWVGENYKQGFQNKKILILGDSHYCAKDENRNDACLSKGDCSYDCMNDDCYKMTRKLILEEYLEFRSGLPDGAPESPDYTLKAEYNGVIYDTPIRTFKLDRGKLIRAIIIQHPCCRWGKDQTKWHTLLKAFFETK